MRNTSGLQALSGAVLVNKNKWNHSGLVVECQYKVKLDGMGRIMLKIWVFLRKIVPYGPIIDDDTSPKNKLPGSQDQGVDRGTDPSWAADEQAREQVRSLHPKA